MGEGSLTNACSSQLFNSIHRFGWWPATTSLINTQGTFKIFNRNRWEVLYIRSDTQQKCSPWWRLEWSRRCRAPFQSTPSGSPKIMVNFLAETLHARVGTLVCYFNLSSLTRRFSQAPGPILFKLGVGVGTIHLLSLSFPIFLIFLRLLNDDLNNFLTILNFFL